MRRTRTETTSVDPNTALSANSTGCMVTVFYQGFDQIFVLILFFSTTAVYGDPELPLLLIYPTNCSTFVFVASTLARAANYKVSMAMCAVEATPG